MNNSEAVDSITEPVFESPITRRHHNTNMPTIDSPRASGPPHQIRRNRSSLCRLRVGHWL